MKKIGECIRQARKSSGLSQEELAAKIHVNRSYLSLVENGKSSPTFEFLEKVASGLGTPVEVMIVSPHGSDDLSADAGNRNIYEGLTDLLNDEQQMLLMNPSPDEIRIMRSIRVDPHHNPSKKFFVEALLDYRKNRLAH